MSRTFPLQSSTTCSIPATAQAYSLNFAVVPPGPLLYISVWPTGQPKSLVSTLNDLTGTIVAAAAIVPAGTSGSIDVYATNNTDIIIDINGYYAAPTDLNGNTAIGAGTLANNITGKNNTATGQGALSSNTTGWTNTAVGSVALFSNTTGSANTAIGPALYSNTTGGDNTATGDGALWSNTVGWNNTAVGYTAIFSNTTGWDNTAIGWSALFSNTSGGANTAIGEDALYSNTTGNNNIAIGYLAASNVTGGNNIHIGNSGSTSDSGTIRIGSSTSIDSSSGPSCGPQTSFFAAGIRGTTTANNDAVPVLIDSAGQLGTVSSSRRFKEDIQDMGDVSNGLMRLRPVTFRYQKPFADGSKPIQYGLIAEEVAEVYPDLVAHSAEGQIETVKYQVLDSMLVNEVQRQQKEIGAQHEHIQRLEAALSGELQRNRALEERLSRLEAAVANTASGAGVQ
jgi:hypothetical protein